MKSFLKTFFKYMILIIVLFISIVVIINTSAFDEKLNPEIHNLMTDIPMPKVENNAYYAIMGISAQSNKDIVSTGHALIQRYIENRKNGNDDISSNDYEEILGTEFDGQPWLDDLHTCDFKTDLNCLNKLYKSPISQSMLKRYNEIIKMNVYENFLDMTITSPLPSYSSMVKLNELKLFWTYHNDRTNFLQLLNNDLAFWKLMLNQSSFLIDKMVAIAVIQKDILFLSEFIKNNSLSESNNPVIKNILKPLNSKELDFSSAYISESRMLFNLSSAIEKNSTWLEKLLFQPNSTLNSYYENYVKNQIKISKMPLEELIVLHKENQGMFDSEFKFHYLYNFTGKTFLGYSGCINCTDYIIKGHDLNNMIKMVNIQFQAKVDNQQSLQELLLQPHNLNLYNNKPFKLDKKEQKIYFECLAFNSTCEINL